MRLYYSNMTVVTPVYGPVRYENQSVVMKGVFGVNNTLIWILQVFNSF